MTHEMSGKVRRSLFQLVKVGLIFALIGSATSIGVSWTGAVRWHQQFLSAGAHVLEVQASNGELFAWLEESKRGLAESHQFQNFSDPEAPPSSLKFHSTLPVPSSTLKDLPRGWGRRLYLFGWPARSMWGAADSFPPEVWPPARFLNCSMPMTQSPWPWGIQGRLPTGVLWPGFLLNSGIFGIACWLPWFAALTIRRRLRMRTGLCLSCGYELKGLAAGSPCPECGVRAKAD